MQTGGALAKLSPRLLAHARCYPAYRPGLAPIPSTSSAMQRRSATPPPWRPLLERPLMANAILVMNCPTALASSTDAAEAVIGSARGTRASGDVPAILTNWL